MKNVKDFEGFLNEAAPVPSGSSGDPGATTGMGPRKPVPFSFTNELKKEDFLVTDENLPQFIKTPNKLVIVDFGNLNWCEACVRMKKAFDEIRVDQKLKDKFVLGTYEVDGWEGNDVTGNWKQPMAKKYVGGAAIPFVVFFRNGKMVHKFEGFGGNTGHDKSFLISLINKF